MAELNPTDRIEDSVIHFEEGIIGVPRARRFQLLEKPGSAYHILRCLDIEGFNLPVVDPQLLIPDYGPKLSPRVTAALDLQAGDQLLLLAVASLEPEGPVANLRAPVVINVNRRLASQVILEDRSYPLRAPLGKQNTMSKTTAAEQRKATAVPTAAGTGGSSHAHPDTKARPEHRRR